MKKVTLALFITVLLFFSCKENENLSNNRLALDDSVLSEEIFIGKMFYHDQPPGQAMDCYMADLYVKLLGSPTVPATNGLRIQFLKKPDYIKPGINRIRGTEIKGIGAREITLNARQSLDPSQYEFIVRNVENLTNTPFQDSSVNVNSRNQIAFISNRTGTYEIFYLDINDRVQHQLTPINGQYKGPNTDPGWKTDDIIVFSHQARIVEANIHTLEVSDPLIPEESWAMYDPKYSPDGNKILFSAWVRGKKNGYMKDMITKKISQVLPSPYAGYKDDNPTWIFSNTIISGHVFYPARNGRIYFMDKNHNIDILTPSNKDFRYVTPVKIFADTYLVFSDWSSGGLSSTLWICTQDGSYLRPLNLRGDEAVFLILHLPIPRSDDELKKITKEYNSRFND